MDYYNNYETLTQGLYSGSDYTSSMYSTAAGVGIWGIIALILAIVGGILVYFLFFKS